MRDEDEGLVPLLVGDGRSLLILTGLALLFSGGFALFLAARREFLPHDIRYLGMSADALCALGGCRVAAFMFHDRVAFGGTLLAVGTLYLWLAALPLRRGEPWAWWAFVVSGAAGFLSFLAYLGYGYLDDWHAIATTLLLPLEVFELSRRFSPLKIVTLIVNLAVVVYLLYAKRLFGVRGGGAAEAALHERDAGWPAVERATPA